jgi:hypothetical protein
MTRAAHSIGPLIVHHDHQDIGPRFHPILCHPWPGRPVRKLQQRYPPAQRIPAMLVGHEENMLEIRFQIFRCINGNKIQ